MAVVARKTRVEKCSVFVPHETPLARGKRLNLDVEGCRPTSRLATPYTRRIVRNALFVHHHSFCRLVLAELAKNINSNNESGTLT